MHSTSCDRINEGASTIHLSVSFSEHPIVRMRLIPSTAIYHQQCITQPDYDVSLLRIGLKARVGLSALTGLLDSMSFSDTEIECALSFGIETQ